MNHPYETPNLITNTVLERVQAWAERLPDQTCVREGGRYFTYGTLSEYVEEGRRRLARAGVGAGNIVAVSCTRRGPAIAGMLAAWSVGAAYMPLAPTLPKARVELILSQARPAAVLTDAEGVDAPAECREGRGPQTRLGPSASYVIFTSGSSGTPKGTVLGHSGLDLLTRWYRDVSSLAPGEYASQIADLTFDASVWEIWGALANGASLVVPTLDEFLEPSSLQRFLLDNRVRTGFVPTGLIPGLLSLEWPRKVPLRVLFTGGDRLTDWPEPRHPFRLVNAYGPTECTVVATSCPLSPDEAESAPPIGRPLPYIEAGVVGPQRAPVRPGERGELWLSGPAVALGYLGGADEQDVFVVGDLGSGSRRWYRTGDLVREDSDGLLHYISRIDDQVQVGGRRTEPAEIARTILRLPRVAEAVVFTRTTPSGAMRLAAAVTPDHVTRDEIHAHLREHLPPYMIPPDVLALDSIPLTGNGKFDVVRLRALLAERSVPSTGVASTDPVEVALAEDWRESCGVVPERPDDTLVELGAGSLDLIALSAQIASRLRVTVPPSVLKLTQTLGEQARLVAGLVPDDAPRVPCGAQEGPASLGQEAIVFLEEVSGTSMGYGYQMVLEGPGAPDSVILEKALRVVAESQTVLRSRWHLTPRGLVGRGVEPNVLLDRHDVDSDDVPGLLTKLVARPIRHTDYPLVAWDLITHQGGTALLQREHHLVHDGWSVGVLLRLVQDAYRSLEQGTGWVPPDQGVTYFDWAREQRAWVDGPMAADAKRFWREHLEGAPKTRPVLPWPVALERAGAVSKTRLQPLGRDLSARLNETSAALGVTPFALLLAAFRRLVVGYQGAEHSLLGSGFANRDVDTRDLVGMFVNVLPLSRHVETGETAVAGIRDEMSLLARAGRHQSLPTSEIVRLLGHGSSLDHNPLYQVMFSQHDAPQPDLRLGGWRPTVRELWNGHGKTDLNVIVMNRGLQHARNYPRSGDRNAGSYTLRWEFDPALYPEHIVRVLQQRMGWLLDHCCERPELPWPSFADEWNGEIDD